MSQIQAKRRSPITYSSLDSLNGVQKIAVLMVTLGTKTAADMLRALSEQEVEAITLEIANMRNVDSDVVFGVLKEYYHAMVARSYTLEGGYDKARELLGLLGSKIDIDKVMRILKENTELTVFEQFQENKVSQIANFIKNEHPQVAALIFSQLRVDRIAEILEHLEPDFQADVIYRLAAMDKITSEVVREIEGVIKEQMGGMDALGDQVRSGTQTVAQILNEADITVEKNVLEEIEERDPQMADDIKEKMFLFEDIGTFDDRTLQLVIGELDWNDMVMGLKGIHDDLFNKFTYNMSTRASDMLEEDMAALGPVPVKEVKEAQQRIIRRIRELEGDSQIVIRKGGDVEVVE